MGSVQNQITTKASSLGNAAQYHGNNLKNTATTYGYTLRDKASGAIKKFGETMNPDTRYTKSWLKENNVEMFKETSGTKLDMRVWEHEQIGEYIMRNGAAPAFNNIERSVNVFH